MAVDDSYTKLLLHCDGTDGSTTFTDEAGKSVTANGNAQIDTTYKKFGTGSGLFDGTGDYLTVPDSDDFAFGTGDFTIDFWYMQNSAVAYAPFVGQRPDSNNTWIFHTGLNGLRPRFASVNGGTVTSLYETTSDQTFTANTWYHLAVVRNGTNFYIFKDGTSLALTVTQAIGTNNLGNIAGNLYIGADQLSTYSPLNGALDEFRFSKGIARWTANFTPPTSPYAPANNTGFFMFM